MDAGANDRPLLLMDTDDWRDHAACTGMSTSPQAARLWFPERGDNTAKAKRICNEQCPVRDECLDDALATGERFGIRGGLTERARRTMRRRQPVVTRCGTDAGYMRHYRAGEEACPPCKRAHADYTAERKAGAA